MVDVRINTARRGGQGWRFGLVSEGLGVGRSGERLSDPPLISPI
jgi:hypothetical protein